MTPAKVAGQRFELEPKDVERAVDGLDPEPIREHYVVIGRRRYPPKQILAAITGLDRADFTTHQARSILNRLGYGVHRRAPVTVTIPTPELTEERARRRAEIHAKAEALRPYIGRWVAQDGSEVLFDADSPHEIVAWLRRHGRQGRVWRVPTASEEIAPPWSPDL